MEELKTSIDTKADEAAFKELEELLQKMLKDFAGLRKLLEKDTAKAIAELEQRLMLVIEERVRTGGTIGALDGAATVKSLISGREIPEQPEKVRRTSVRVERNTVHGSVVLFFQFVVCPCFCRSMTTSKGNCSRDWRRRGAPAKSCVVGSECHCPGRRLRVVSTATSEEISMVTRRSGRLDLQAPACEEASHRMRHGSKIQNSMPAWMRCRRTMKCHRLVPSQLPLIWYTVAVANTSRCHGFHHLR